MIIEPKIGEIVASKIKRDEELGTQTGSSGHLGHKSFVVDEISPLKQVDRGWEIKYRYTIVIETEFTIYPDNPPYEERYEKTIVVDDIGNVIDESEKVSLGGTSDEQISEWMDTLDP